MTVRNNLLLTRVTVQEYYNIIKNISVARPFLILANMESGPWEKMKYAKMNKETPLFDKRKQKSSAHKGDINVYDRLFQKQRVAFKN